MIIYQTQDGLVKIDVAFDHDTVWLSLEQMAQLFQRDKSVISRHIRNIFSEGELVRDSVVAKNATTAADGKNYQVEYYNLDVIIAEVDDLMPAEPFSFFQGDPWLYRFPKSLHQTVY